MMRRPWIQMAGGVLAVVGAFGALSSRAFVASAAEEKVYHSKVYQADTQKKVLLFTSVRTDRTEGDRTTITEIFRDADGKEAVRLDGVLVGDQLVSYSVDQIQAHEKGKIEVKDGKIHFEYTDQKGKTKADSEKLAGNFVIGLTLRHFVQKHWKDLLDGKTVEMRFGVPERQETVGFKLFKDQEFKANDGKEVLVLKMKPTSMVIAAIVNPLYFFFDKSNGKLLEFKGRTIPKLKTKDGFKDLVAESTYD